MLRKLLKACGIFAIGAITGVLLMLAKEPQLVHITLSSQGKCAVKHGQDVHMKDCQVLSKGTAYMEYQW